MAHMDVLLREDVEDLGHRGQVVRVRAGYGRNYLLPRGLAIEASLGNKRMIEEERRVLAKREAQERGHAEGQASNLDGLDLRFDRRVGEHGMLYGSVTALDIAEALKERGFSVEKRRIGLREPIKEVGDYEITIKLHREIAPIVKVRVRKEGAPDELVVEPEAADSHEAEAAPAEPGAETAAETPREELESPETTSEPAAGSEVEREE